MDLFELGVVKKMIEKGGSGGGTSTPTWDNILNKPNVVLSVNGSTPDTKGNVEVAGGGVSVQPDWNQNDATKMDYIKNRPFYEEVTETTAPLDISWDGDISKQESYLYGTELGLSTYYARFSDLAPTKEEMLAGTIAINGSEAVSISGGFEIKTIEEQFGAADAVGYVVYGKVNGASAPWVLCVKEEATLGEAVFPKGLFLLALVYSGATTSYTANLSLPSVSTVETVVHHIDPKYIKDMYYEEIQEGGFVEVLAEKEVTVSNGMYVEQGVFWDYALGDTCIVTWEGVEYECVAMPATYSGANVIALGNLAIFGGEGGNNEPFAIGVISGVGSGVIVPVDGTYTVGIKKSGSVNVIHKIDNKYIDAEWMAKVKREDKYLIPETTLTEVEAQNTRDVYKISVDDSTQYPTVGEEYTVNWKGTEYKVTCFNYPLAVLYGKDVPCLGNIDYEMGSYEGYEPTGEPFWITYGVYSEEQIWIMTDSGSSDVSVSVYGPADTIPILPEKFLPKNATAVVTGTNSAQLALEAGKTVFFEYNGTTYTVLSAWGDLDWPVMLLCRASSNYDSCNLYLYAPNGFLTVAPGDSVFVNLFPKMLAGESSIELDSVVLNSSTEGSTKQFKITVDDSGTLTATEVTN